MEARLSRRLLVAALGAALVLAAGPAYGADQGIFPYPIHTVVLENGLRLVMVPMPTPGVVDFETVVRAGSRNEVEPGRTGYAHFFEHMMFRGTPLYPEERYRRVLDVLGADHNGSTDMDRTAYYIMLPSSGLRQVIAMEADRFRNLRYSIEQFRKEAGAVLGELAIDRSRPETVLEETRLALAFHRHPYGHTTIGFEADVRGMPDGYDYSLLFYDRYYRPESCVILVAGDFDPAQVENLVRAQYDGWPRGGSLPEIPEEPPLEGPVRRDLVWEGPTRPILDLSFRTPAYDEKTLSTASLELIREAYFGTTSDLYRELVLERRWLESVSASFERTRNPYLFIVTARLLDPADFEIVRQRILATLQQAGDRPIGEKRLEDAKRRLLATMALSLDTPGGVNWRLSGFLSLTGDPNSIEHHFAAVAAASPADLMEAARHYLTPSNSITVTLATKGQHSP